MWQKASHQGAFAWERFRATMVWPVAVGGCVLLKDSERRVRCLIQNQNSESDELLQKRSGALIGAVIGDCLGRRFENPHKLQTNPLKLVQKHTETSEIRAWISKVTGQQHKYTDDTAMTLCVGENLAKHGTVVPTELGKCFRESFEKDPKRGYGRGVKES